MTGRRENIRGILFILLVACAGLVLPASGAGSSSVPKIIQDNLNKKFSTDADGVILYEKRSLTLEKDGKVTERVKIIQKVITDFAVDEFCDPRIRFNARHQEIKIIEASSTMPDGKKMVTGDNGKNLSTPETIAPFPHFADIREMIVSHVGVETGAVTVLEYEVKDKKPWRNFFYGLERFVDDRDIEKKILEIKVPSGKKLGWKAGNFKPEVIKTKSGGYDVYTFKIEAVEGVNLHEGGHGGGVVLPRLFYSEEVDGKTLAHAIMGGSCNFGSGPSDKNADRAEEILKKIKSELKDEMMSPLDRTVYIYRRVADWLGDAEIDRKIFGWKMRPPHEAFSSGYADVYEKLGILYSLFARMGYSPVPVVTLHAADSDVMAHPDNISGAWIKISAHGFYLYLPVKSSGIYGEPRPGKAFVVKNDGLAPAQFVKPATTRFRVDLSVDMRKDPYVFSATLKLRGKYNPYWGIFLSDGSLEAGQIAQEALGQDSLTIENASFQRLALDESIILVSGRVNAVENEVDIELQSKMLGNALSRLEIWRQSRETPLMVEEKEIESLGITVLLPEEGGVNYIPAFKEKELQMSFDGLPEKGEKGSMKVYRKAKKVKGKVRVARKVILKPGIVRPSQYKKLRNTLSDAFSPNSTRVIIKLPAE